MHSKTVDIAAKIDEGPRLEIDHCLSLLGIGRLGVANRTMGIEVLRFPAELHGVVGALVTVALDQRQAAKDRKDYQAADAIRDRLLAAGVLTEDTPDGPRWTIKR